MASTAKVREGAGGTQLPWDWDTYNLWRRSPSRVFTLKKWKLRSTQEPVPEAQSSSTHVCPKPDTTPVTGQMAVPPPGAPSTIKRTGCRCSRLGWVSEAVKATLCTTPLTRDFPRDKWQGCRDRRCLRGHCEARVTEVAPEGARGSMPNCGVHTNTNRCYSSQACTPTRNANLPTWW